MKIVVLCRRASSSFALINWLRSKDFTDLFVVYEEPAKKTLQIRRRAKQFGWLKALGQALFMVTAVPFLKWESRERTTQLMSFFQLDSKEPKLSTCIVVSSINDDIVSKLLHDTSPTVVIVNGTQIIREHVLRSTTATIINCHAGITPKYRGVHGGYWALRQNDLANFGVTLHLVDAGVDTGQVLDQVIVEPSEADNFASYPLLQQTAALSSLNNLLTMISVGNPPVPKSIDAETSRQWTHPTLVDYILGRVKGVK